MSIVIFSLACVALVAFIYRDPRTKHRRPQSIPQGATIIRPHQLDSVSKDPGPATCARKVIVGVGYKELLWISWIDRHPIAVKEMSNAASRNSSIAGGRYHNGSAKSLSAVAGTEGAA